MKAYLLSSPNESDLHYFLRRSERATKTRIVVSANKVEVVAPMKTSERCIRSFVDSQQLWIRDAVKRIHSRSDKTKSLSPAEYIDGVTVPYRGDQIPLTVTPTSAKQIRLQLVQDKQFVVYLPATHQEFGSDRIRRALEQWMKLQVRQQASELIAKHSLKHQLVPRSLRIKTQKSRWGSCGPNNDINLNWLLALAPPIILEYVVVHELCHIKHKNHSKDFWTLVSDYMPDYLTHRRWLKQHGASLMRGL
ncbi:MAG: SprT family zinc-dependent metalloprotease [Methylomonas sp.]|nr:SprT family zinc-dependent metalloprotease [Methylomonas sp.]